MDGCQIQTICFHGSQGVSTKGPSKKGKRMQKGQDQLNLPTEHQLKVASQACYLTQVNPVTKSSIRLELPIVFANLLGNQPFIITTRVQYLFIYFARLLGSWLLLEKAWCFSLARCMHALVVHTRCLMFDGHIFYVKSSMC